MKTVEKLVSELRSLDITIWSEGNKLRYQAPEGTLSSDLLNQLRDRKVEILAFLHSATTTRVGKSPAIQPCNRNQEVSLSFAQQRLWFLDQLEPGSSAYNMPAAYRLTGSLNVTALGQSLNEIVRRHEILRTSFPSVEGQPHQVIAASLPLTLSMLDLQRLSTEEREVEVNQQAIEAAQQPFDLAQGPLFRVKLLRLADDDHVLLLNMHHIISDGWSFNVFFKELTTLYGVFSSSKPSPLPDLSIQYADFSIWQRQWLQGEVLQSQLDYWLHQLGGELPILQLPTDYPRPPIQTYQGSSQSLELPLDLAESLKNLSQQEGVTLFMTLLAAFKVLLFRYSGQEDIIVGSPIAGRNRIETEPLIGCFVNTSVLRTDLSMAPSFRELLGRVRETALGAFTHQELPFEKLVEELQPERDLSRTPLFQVWFNMVTTEDIQLELSGLEVQLFNLLDTPSKFDLTLYIKDHQKGIKLTLVYNADLFKSVRMDEMLAQFQNLLEQAVETPEKCIYQFSLVTASAKELLPDPSQLLVTKYESTVHYPFVCQALQTPEKLAIVDSHASWTYRELDGRSNQLANYLAEKGIHSEDVVAIYGHRSASLVWTILGILKAGAAFLILDPAYPSLRLIDCLCTSQAKGFIHLEAAGELPKPLAAYIEDGSFCCSLRLSSKAPDSAHHELENWSTKDLGASVDPDQLAYISFTSGSTGKPKGILGTHRPLSHFLQWHRQTFGLTHTDRFCMLSGLSHDPLLRDIFTPLWLGASLYIPAQQDIETPGQLIKWMERHEVSIAHLTPAMGQLLSINRQADSKLPSLRYVFFGGDVLTTNDLTKIQQLAPNVTCVNFYGATETPQAMGAFPLVNLEEQFQNGRSITSQVSLPIGQGIEGVQLLILNATQEVAGIGEMGEIYIRTPYLSKGYIGDELLTHDRFIINPFTQIKSDRLYKTGDLARYLPHGNIEFLGRLDNQVKIRGFRIELGEVEAALSQHPNLQQVAVMAREDNPGDKRLVAYIVSTPEHTPTTDELHRFLKQKLPDYMLPSAFVFLEALPLTPNGKLDRRALIELAQTRHEPIETFVAPCNELELQLTKIWEKVLDIKPIGARDNFFDLGGHSLLAVTLLAQIEKEFGKILPLSILFQAATVGELANIIRHQKCLGSSKSLVEIQPNGSKPPFFCVHEADGHVLCYRELANYLGSDQPFYGLQPQHIAGKRGFHSWVEDVAAHYIKEMRIIQPEGPYLLGGLCMGGILAFEMAQQLQAQGQKVALLALFDAAISLPKPPLRRHLNQLLQLDFREKFTYILKIAKWKIARSLKPIKAKSTLVAYRIYLNNKRFFPQVSYKIPVRAAFGASWKYYIPTVYQGRVTLFRVDDGFTKKFPNAALFGWDELASDGVEVYDVPGHHGDRDDPVSTFLQEPYVQIFAAKLKVCIDKAQTNY
jgi:amino acid adenylation domain-containing protein